jgi:hypothetical protein
VPVEAWLIAGAAYVGLVAVAQAVMPVRTALGFAKSIPDALIASDAVIDVASEAEGPRVATGAPLPAA